MNGSMPAISSPASSRIGLGEMGREQRSATIFERETARARVVSHAAARRRGGWASLSLPWYACVCTLGPTYNANGIDALFGLLLRASSSLPRYRTSAAIGGVVCACVAGHAEPLFGACGMYLRGRLGILGHALAFASDDDDDDAHARVGGDVRSCGVGWWR